MSDLGGVVRARVSATPVSEVSRLTAPKTKSFAHASLALVVGELFKTNGINVHSVGVSRSRRLARNVSFRRRGVEIFLARVKDVGAFPLSFEVDGPAVPVVDGGRNGVHRHDSPHEGGINPHSKIIDEDALVGDSTDRDFVFERLDVRFEGKFLGDLSSGEPSYSIALGIFMDKGRLEVAAEVIECPEVNRVMPQGGMRKSGRPDFGGILGHVGQCKDDFLFVIIVELLVQVKVKSYGQQPGFCFGGSTVKVGW